MVEHIFGNGGVSNVLLWDSPAPSLAVYWSIIVTLYAGLSLPIINDGMLLEHCIKNKDDYGLRVVVILHFENSPIATLKPI